MSRNDSWSVILLRWWGAFCFGLMLAALMSGCVDRRVKEASNLNSIKVVVAEKEFEAAKTSEEKLKIAKEYFATAPRLIKVVDDALWGRKAEEQKIELLPNTAATN